MRNGVGGRGSKKETREVDSKGHRLQWRQRSDRYNPRLVFFQPIHPLGMRRPRYTQAEAPSLTFSRFAHLAGRMRHVEETYQEDTSLTK